MRYRRIAIHILIGTVIVGALVLFGVAPAASRPPTHWEQLAACAQRVVALEAQVRRLRQELSARPASPNSRPEPRQPVPAPLGAPKPPTDPCDPPYELDIQGLKHYKPECMALAKPAPCSVPFAVTTSGVKRYNQTCLAASKAGPDCDPPYEYDAAGIKRYKPDCL